MDTQAVVRLNNAVVYFLNGGEARYAQLNVYGSGMLLVPITRTVISPAAYGLVIQE